MRIDFEHLTVEVSGHRALDDISGAFASGGVTAVIGPSGAGKSTLLRVLAGLIAPDAGRVRFDGADVTSLRPEERRLGVVFQDLRLFDFLSARDNVAFAPRVARVPASLQLERVDEALRLVRAGAFADRPARVLSGGERQRIAIARALAARPRALLLDEPFASLDAELRRSIREELREVVRALGVTAVVITHDRDDAFALASHFVVLSAGRIEQVGASNELYLHPATEYVATLLGEANLVAIDAREGDRVRVSGLVRSATGNGRRVLIRPEQLRVAGAATVTPTDGWAARVTDLRCSGAGWRVQLDAGSLGPLIAYVATPPAGENVWLVPPEEVHTV
ncbi:MAG: sulfate transporter, ATPase subunit [Myxococcales bacterium]|nr:sulfate transporter, ATPase subunit [Myxococcales bacterium]